MVISNLWILRWYNIRCHNNILRWMQNHPNFSTNQNECYMINLFYIKQYQFPSIFCNCMICAPVFLFIQYRAHWLIISYECHLITLSIKSSIIFVGYEQQESYWLVWKDWEQRLQRTLFWQELSPWLYWIVQRSVFICIRELFICIKILRIFVYMGVILWKSPFCPLLQDQQGSVSFPSKVPNKIIIDLLSFSSSTIN